MTNEEQKTLIAVPTRIFKVGYILKFDRTLQEWQKCAEIKERETFAYKVAVLGNSLIFIAGCYDSLDGGSDVVYSYNLETKEWSNMARLLDTREGLCVAQLDDVIYAIGGVSQRYEKLKSVERYDPSIGKWEDVPPMRTPRVGATAVALHGKIYVIGGSFKSYQNSMECYDPQINRWRRCADMAETRTWLSATAHKGYIYVLGGMNIKYLDTVERYDPVYDRWAKICPLSVARKNICTFSLDNRLWAVGGQNNGESNVVELYDEENDKWIEQKALPFGGVYEHLWVRTNLANQLTDI
ncbi:kelch-like protein diablo isoform X1 [Zeugodacus cucurbitae]|uniref:Kelch-like protein 5 n=2 Tax=Zeugodacus cucurbitae TaxID=28588 RepID=A0A0A1XR72_ZEUCU|nr:kelch-like protein diablo isoform X1 [Zeugodacus cucurbitae]